MATKQHRVRGKIDLLIKKNENYRSDTGDEITLDQAEDEY